MEELLRGDTAEAIHRGPRLAAAALPVIRWRSIRRFRPVDALGLVTTNPLGGGTAKPYDDFVTKRNKRLCERRHKRGVVPLDGSTRTPPAPLSAV